MVELHSMLRLKVGQAPDKAEQTMMHKACKAKREEVMQHVRCVQGGQYAFIEWESDYERNKQEEEAWQKT